MARRVQQGRKTAAAAVAKGEKAPPGSPARQNLAANKAALKRADELLAGLSKAQKLMAQHCCHNDQSCTFLVLSSRVRG